MNLSDLKTKPIPELLEIAHEMGMDNLGRSRKQEIIANVLRKHAKGGEAIYGDGTLEILQDGFGFLRSPDSSYLAGPDDIYVSPSQIRRLACAPVILFPEKFDHRKTVNAISHS